MYRAVWNGAVLAKSGRTVIRAPAAPGRGAAVSPAAGSPGGGLVSWRPGCPYHAMLRLGLRSARVPATWVNIWEDRVAAARVRAITGGDETVPTVVVGARAMVNPSARQVIAAVGGGQAGTGPSAGTRAAAWLARMAGFFSRRPRLGHRADGNCGPGALNGTAHRGGYSPSPALAETPDQ